MGFNSAFKGLNSLEGIRRAKKFYRFCSTTMGVIGTSINKLSTVKKGNRINYWDNSNCGNTGSRSKYSGVCYNKR